MKLMRGLEIERFKGQIIGFSGALIGCACTAFAPNALTLKLIGFCGMIAFMVAIHIAWHRRIATANDAAR